ncbi:hypothetical protein [Clostridium kluyveri]|uniref:Uncharacterized protein n=1 Tax=Clostridium kluyveri TaxID=1534 RepID=A0A1L5FBK2_CLOKL|nr:hypothetical protein [Clostridium kluyveri]APM40385.1 hypothetical protein BS101_17410 [Clostridium kluyveri]
MLDKHTNLSGDLAEKYPNGVKFTEEGVPDFKPYSTKTVTVDNLELMMMFKMYITMQIFLMSLKDKVHISTVKRTFL